MKRIKFLSLLLVLSTLISMLSISASASNNEPLISDQQILQATQALIAAEAEYYNISNIAVQNVLEEPQEDGTTHVLCDLVFTMCLKAESVEELPYIEGLLDGVGMTSYTECLEASNVAYLSSTAYGHKKMIGVISEDTVIARDTARFISAVAENIGNETEIYYGILLNVTESGDVNYILGHCAGTTFPLSDYFPASSAQMYENGCAHAREIAASAVSVAAEINKLKELYYRVDARNYANRYTSNATIYYGGSKVPMNPAYYNPSYNYFIGEDCANYVSQAIRHGGIYLSSTWQPGQYAWHNVGGLYDYFVKNSNYAIEASYETCVAGGFIIFVSGAGSQYHVVMCVLNDTVNHAYSGHTSDVLRKAYTDSLGYDSDDYGSHAEYFNFINTTTGTQYSDGQLD